MQMILFSVLEIQWGVDYWLIVEVEKISSGAGGIGVGLGIESLQLWRAIGSECCGDININVIFSGGAGGIGVGLDILQFWRARGSEHCCDTVRGGRINATEKCYISACEIN